MKDWWFWCWFGKSRLRSERASERERGRGKRSGNESQPPSVFPTATKSTIKAWTRTLMSGNPLCPPPFTPNKLLRTELISRCEPLSFIVCSAALKSLRSMCHRLQVKFSRREPCESMRRVHTFGEVSVLDSSSSFVGGRRVGARQRGKVREQMVET